MKVTLSPANNSTKDNPPELQVDGVVFRHRDGVTKFLKHVEAEMNLLWPVESLDFNELIKDKK